MQVCNVKYHPDLSWEQYLQLPGLSFSSLKEFTGPETYGMHIGKLVHRYVLKPKEYNYEEADVVMPIAAELIKFVGYDILRQAICECPMTADFCSQGFVFNWRGIPDFQIPKVIVVDFKIIAGGTLRGYIERFKYDGQLRGYMMPVRAELGLIIAYNRAKRRVELEPIKPDNDFWRDVTIRYGTAKQTTI